MANDKVAAATHGRRFAFGDKVLVTELPEFDRRLGEIEALSRNPIRGYLVRFGDGEQYGWFSESQMVRVEEDSTGEHAWGKLTEDTIAAYSEADAKATTRMYETLPSKPKRDWTPTKGELALAMGIVLFIVGIFWFVVTYYPM